MLPTENSLQIQRHIQTEVSQKEKNKYCILTHLCGIQNNGIEDLICKAELESKCMDTKGDRGGGGTGRLGLTYIHY